MADFRICFYNDLPDSTGHDHHVCQRTILIPNAVDEERAIVQAKREFGRLEQVTHWDLHARTIECARLDGVGRVSA